MSFGFSVGDILLASRLAYKLYSTVTYGKRSAAKDLQELGDALFGLRCALDHLGRAAEDIWATASNTPDANALEIRHKLNTMVCSCGITLQELDSVTKKYREAAEPAESEVSVEHDVGIVQAVGTSTPPNKKRSIVRFKENVQVNWLKIRWGIERSSLSEYRARLQSHIDSINMVLNTFLWCVSPLHQPLDFHKGEQTPGPQLIASRLTADSTPRRCRSYKIVHYSLTNHCYSWLRKSATCLCL